MQKTITGARNATTPIQFMLRVTFCCAFYSVVQCAWKLLGLFPGPENVIVRHVWQAAFCADRIQTEKQCIASLTSYWHTQHAPADRLSRDAATRCKLCLHDAP